MAASHAPEFRVARDVTRPHSGPRLTADTSSQPEGITRRVMLNVLEAFFRRPILHLLPLILMLGVGVASVVNGSQEYRAGGTFSVTNESLLADLTNAAQTPGLSFDSPASVTAAQINELMRTNQFLDDVASEIGVDALLQSGALSRGQLRQWTRAVADGQNIVRVQATTPDPELSFRLADATMSSYLKWVVAADVSQSTSTETSLEARVAEKQAAADAADTAVRDEILQQPDVAMEDRSPVDQQDFARLQGIAVRAQGQLVAAQDALDAARLQTDQAAAIVAQRLQVLDRPVTSAAAQAGLRQAVITMGLFFFLGAVLSVVSVVLSATLDRTIRVPDDITRRYGVDVLAVVPDTAH